MWNSQRRNEDARNRRKFVQRARYILLKNHSGHSSEIHRRKFTKFLSKEISTSLVVPSVERTRRLLNVVFRSPTIRITLQRRVTCSLSHYAARPNASLEKSRECSNPFDNLASAEQLARRKDEERKRGKTNAWSMLNVGHE